MATACAAIFPLAVAPDERILRDVGFSAAAGGLAIAALATLARLREGRGVVG